MIINPAIDMEPLAAGAGAFTGVDEQTRPSLLADTVLARCTNGLLDASGQLTLRPGTTWLATPISAPVQGIGYYDALGFEALLVVAGGRCWQLTGTAQNETPVEITGFSPALQTTAPVRFAQLVDKLYLHDGTRLYQLSYNSGTSTWTVTGVPNFTDTTALKPFAALVPHAFRLIGAGLADGESDSIYCSDVLAGTSWLKTSNVRIGRGDGDPIVALVSGQQSQLLIIKERSVWALDTSAATLAGWASQAITQLIGCVAGRTVQTIGQDTLFLTRRGVASLSRLAAADSVSEAVFVSLPIKPTIDRINWAAVRTAHATEWQGYYLLAVPLDSATTPNAILCWNSATGQWSGTWTGIAATAAELSRFGSRAETILGDSLGRVLRIDAGAATDQRALGFFDEIALEATTKAWDHGAADNLKLPFTALLDWIDSRGVVDVSLVRDGQAPELIEAASRTNRNPQLPTLLPFVLAFQPQVRRRWNLAGFRAYREAQLRISTTSGYVCLREAKLHALPGPEDLILQ